MTAGAREVRAPRGTELSCKGWQQEAALRMLMNNLDPEVAERPDDLVVYGGTGRAARSWEAFDAIVRELRRLEGDETLLIQSGKPVGVVQTHEWAPRVLIANSNLVPEWANWEEFRRLEALGLTMYGQMTAGSWIYIGTQGILQGTYETFAAIGAKRGGTLAGTISLTAGLGGMGGAQPLAVTMNDGVVLCVDVDPTRIERRVKTRYLDVSVDDAHPTGYSVPPTNPFVGQPGVLPEIWSFGLRNPWRFSFDDPTRGGTGALLIADVGEAAWEEVNYEPAGRGGRNYGWRNREGLHNNVTNLPPAFQPLVDPIFEYGHAVGGSVTGGHVYRGAALGDAFRGRYVFADFVAGRIWSLALSVEPSGDARASDLRDHTLELGSPGSISSFGVDAGGELYLVAYSSGSVLRVLGAATAPPVPTGLRIIRP